MSNAATREALNNRRNTNGNGNGGGPYPNRSATGRAAVPPPPPPVELRTRKPTGAVPWPLVLLEGGEKSGKSWALAEFSASDKVGDCYWMDLGEGSADEYAAIPGADYQVIDHDGTWRDIIGQVEAVGRLARQAHENADKPVCLFLDSYSNVWDMLSMWADWLARNSVKARRILAEDPFAEIETKMPQWNRAKARHKRLMWLLMQFPGIVVITARGKDVAKIGDDGQPVANQKDYKVEGPRLFAFDPTVWVRLSRDAKPQIIGARSVHSGIVPGTDPALTVQKFTLEWLVFDYLKCDPYKAHVRDMKPLNPHVGEHAEDSDAAHLTAAAVDAGEEPPPFPEEAPRPGLPEHVRAAVAALVVQVDGAATREAVNALWEQARQNGWLDYAPTADGPTVRESITAAADRVRRAESEGSPA